MNQINDTRYVPAMRLIKSKNNIYTIDVDSNLHQKIRDSHPITSWKYSNSSTEPQYFGHTRLEVLKPLYVLLCLQYSEYQQW